MQSPARYSIRLYHSTEDGGYVAVCPEFPHISAVAPDQVTAVEDLREVIAMAIETYVQDGQPLPEPIPADETFLPSGEFRIRIPRRLHAQLSQRARDEGVSQNTLVVQYLAQGLAAPLPVSSTPPEPVA